MAGGLCGSCTNIELKCVSTDLVAVRALARYVLSPYYFFSSGKVSIAVSNSGLGGDEGLYDKELVYA